MIIFSQNQDSAILSQYITGFEILDNDWEDGYVLNVFITSGDTIDLGEFATEETAKQEMLFLIERITEQPSNTSTYRIPLDRRNNNEIN